MMWIGINAPFVGGNEGIFSIQHDVRIVKNDLLQLIMTVPGERVMRPTFGTPLRRYVFESMDDASVDRLRDDIMSAIRQHEKRVEVDDIIMEKRKSENYLAVKIYVHMIDDPDVKFMIDSGIQIAA